MKICKVILTLLFVFVFNILFAQNIDLPRVSPQAKVMQRIGVTDVIVSSLWFK